MRKWAALCFLICVVWSRTVSLVYAEDVDSLRQKITQTLVTMASIEVRFRCLPVGPSKIDKRNSVSSGVVSEESPTTFMWAKQGLRELFEQNAWPVPKTKTFNRSKVSFNGRECFKFYFIPENPEIVDSVDVHNAPARDAFNNCALSQILGVHVWQTHLTLLDLLQRPGVVYAGTEEVESHLCHKLELGEHETYTDYAQQMTIWVDSEFDYLPRRMEVLVIRDKRTNKPWPPVGYRNVITEFFEVEDLALKRKRWFPKKARSIGDVEILEAKLNPTFDPQYFTPSIPVGTHVIFRDRLVQVPGTSRSLPKSEIVGGDAGVKLRNARSESNDKRRYEMEIEVNRKELRSRRFWYWARVLGIGSVCIIVAVTVWKRFSRRWR